MLRRGGVGITGVVLDIAGGAIVHARIRTSSESWSELTGIAVDADEQGRFSLWADPGEIVVTASADGYAPNRTLGRAPGTFEILLTPESSLVGTVVDAATEQPVAGARVIVGTLDEANDRAGSMSATRRASFASST